MSDETHAVEERLFPVEALEEIGELIKPASPNQITEHDLDEVFAAYNKFVLDLDTVQALLNEYSRHPATTKKTVVRMYNDTINVALAQMTSALDNLHNKLYSPLTTEG